MEISYINEAVFKGRVSRRPAMNGNIDNRQAAITATTSHFAHLAKGNIHQTCQST